MMQDCLNLIISSIRAANGWFMTIVNATGAYGVIVAFVSVVLASRFILAPIIGGAFFRSASDRVNKSNVGGFSKTASGRVKKSTNGKKG